MKKSKPQKNDRIHVLVVDEDGDLTNELGEKLPPPPKREWTMLEDGTMIRTKDIMR